MRRDPNAIDLSQQKLRLAEDVVVWPVRERGQIAYRLEIPSQHKFFRVGYEEYVFISLLDGNTTIPQACGLAAAKLADRAPDANQANSIQRWLLKNELAYMMGNDPPIRRREAAPRDQKGSMAILSRFNPFWIKLPLLKSTNQNSVRHLNAITTSMSWLLSPIMLAIGMLFILIGLATLVGNWSRFVETTAEVFAPSNWLWLMATWVALKFVHELAHAVACHRQGGEVREFGLVLVLFAPLAYVDVTSCWRMTSRWPRIQVSIAGMFVECVVAAVALIAWSQTDSIQAQFLLHNLVFTAGVSTILFNANALMRFDGYFILADLVDIPNLYAESTKEVQQLSKQFFFGQSSPRSSFIGWRLWFIRGYGAAALMWKIVICVTLGMSAATMFSGAGIVLTGLGIFLWFGGPLAKLTRLMRMMLNTDKPRAIRGSAVISVVVAIGMLVFFAVPIPTSVTAPGVVAFTPDAMVRSPADGFVREVYVSDSQFVSAGDPLLEIENPELRARLKRLEIALAKNELQLRGAIRQGDASAELVIRQQMDTLQEQIANVNLQAESLQVVASRDGQITARNLEQIVGTYLREGDPLMNIAKASDKELVALVHQEHIRVARRHVGHSVPVRTASFRAFDGKLNRVEPRATNRLIAPALSSSEGGSLPVESSDQMDDDGEWRLLEPHFSARIALDESTASEMKVGMRIEASLGYCNDSAATRLKKTIRRLWYKTSESSK